MARKKSSEPRFRRQPKPRPCTRFGLPDPDEYYVGRPGAWYRLQVAREVLPTALDLLAGRVAIAEELRLDPEGPAEYVEGGHGAVIGMLTIDLRSADLRVGAVLASVRSLRSPAHYDLTPVQLDVLAVTIERAIKRRLPEGLWTSP